MQAIRRPTLKAAKISLNSMRQSLKFSAIIAPVWNQLLFSVVIGAVFFVLVLSYLVVSWFYCLLVFLDHLIQIYTNNTRKRQTKQNMKNTHDKQHWTWAVPFLF